MAEINAPSQELVQILSDASHNRGNVSIARRHTNRKRIMVFDVETTGLIPKKKYTKTVAEVGVLPDTAEPVMPHILQLSFVIYDTKFWRVVKSYDAYVKVDEAIEISPEITAITGISRETCDTIGVPILQVLREFYEEFMRCDCIVAHNLEFDREMVKIEMERSSKSLEAKGCILWSSIFDDEFMAMHDMETFCTMRVGRAICKIEQTNSRGKYLKSPKLSELYEHLFGKGTVPENLHNSFVDTMVCLRCFVKLRFKFDQKLK